MSGSDLIGEVVENPEDLVKQVTETDEEEETGETASVASSGVEAAAGNIGTVQASVQFSEDSSLDWPVAGNVLLDYSMDGSVFFPTLKVYKYNPALIIGADIGSPVAAAAKGIVDSVKVDEESGTTVAMNIGNGYELSLWPAERGLCKRRRCRGRRRSHRLCERAYKILLRRRQQSLL